ncbi:uncharacterized protein LOC131318596 isoform X1 [Rhododendron vialii]|uniref:uncharacterized protein LOC131318596 isoform X1 n=2 Tax=Rhododendron vialii TaxID=182163 RepID=UPI00265F7F2C|nr:uncharacterized protein LOC131318596 isoform X1 [Rhododendron vialii]
METTSQCRLWWPIDLSTAEPKSSFLLFGWFISSSDIVVAFARDQISFSPDQSRLQGILRETSESMSVSLQDKCTFSLLGHCAVDWSINGQLVAAGVEKDDQVNFSHGNGCTESCRNMSGAKYGQWSCGCCKLDGLHHCSLVSAEEDNWIEVVSGSHGRRGGKFNWIPKLHHIHRKGQTVSNFDFHVILYDIPMFGSHHFSVGLPSSEQVKTHLKKPKWVGDLYRKQPLLDLDTVVMAINSANAAKLCFRRLAGSTSPTTRFPIFVVCITLTWKLLAVSIASLSTLFYLIFRLLHVLLSSRSQSLMYLTLEKVFSNTLRNIEIRRSQMLYWPILLKENVLRSQSCVDYAEKAALHKHSMWSSVAVDILLGYLFGIALFFHSDCACLWVSNSANNITNHLLRNGCAWLMGVPAGFKLNTELAGVLGMISLNAIQIWSTLWFFVGFLFIYFVQGLAIAGVLFGLTTPAALVIDMILLSMLHVSTLHWLISYTYSHQIQAIAALWRLFRGRKVNPLRQRYDSYEYTVEQHIVGSLLFTPLLLLLPTTSVFYIFFTILMCAVSCACLAIDILRSIIHATPYIKIFLWLVRPRRFPSGMWFEIISCRSNAGPMDVGRCSDASTPSEKSWKRTDICGSRSNVLVSILQSNFLNIGQIVWPHYRKVFSEISAPFVASSAYGVLTGRSIPSTLGSGLPSTMPWMSIPWKEYWRICYDAVLGRESDLHRD